MVRTALIARYLAYTGQWTYQVTSARLTDLTYYQWRIVGIDVLGNEATGITHAARRVVRTPDAPAFATPTTRPRSE